MLIMIYESLSSINWIDIPNVYDANIMLDLLYSELIPMFKLHLKSKHLKRNNKFSVWSLSNALNRKRICIRNAKCSIILWIM